MEAIMTIFLAILYLIPVISLSYFIVRIGAEDEWFGLAVIPGLNLVLLIAIVVLVVVTLRIRRDYE
jgi:hypothetical protein